jgi:TatD DNase family protein
MFFVDSHSHLVFSRFSEVFRKAAEGGSDGEYGVEAVIKRAANANVKYMLAIGTELSDLSELQAIVDKYPQIFRTVGIHPLEAKKHRQSYDNEEILRVMKDNCVHPKTVGIGEIGLDYHYEIESKKQQDEIFNMQLELAQECNLPVVIHSRESSDDVIAVLKNYPRLKGVIHCFSGEKHFAQEALNLGFYISISGVVTYKKAAELRDSIKYIPRNRLLIETDCPFLAPVPFRGKLNEPAFLVRVAEEIAELLEISVEEVATFSSSNFFELFHKVSDFLQSNNDCQND